MSEWAVMRPERIPSNAIENTKALRVMSKFETHRRELGAINRS